MGLRMYLNNVLTKPPVPEITETEYSLETIQTISNQDQTASTEGLNTRTAAITNCCSEDVRRNNPMLKVTKKVDVTKKNSFWTFYFTEFTFTNLNQFVNLMQQVKAEDSVLIYTPAALYTDDAEVIVSAITSCKSKDITTCSPYVLNSPAAYVLTAGNRIKTSFVGMMIINLPSVGAGGKALDAKNGLQADIYRRQHILNDLLSLGFIKDSDMKHITECQGSIILFGERLSEIIEKFNTSH